MTEWARGVLNLTNSLTVLLLEPDTDCLLKDVFSSLLNLSSINSLRLKIFDLTEVEEDPFLAAVEEVPFFVAVMVDDFLLAFAVFPDSFDVFLVMPAPFLLSMVAVFFVGAIVLYVLSVCWSVNESPC